MTIQSYPNILYVDSREPPQFAEKLSDLCTIPIEVKFLDTGDFVCGDVCIERKSINDFAMSIIDKQETRDARLFSQSKRMNQQFRKRYIITHDSWEDLNVNIHRHAFLGALASVAAHGTTVIFGLKDEDDFVYLVLKVFEKEGKLVMVPPRKSKKVTVPKTNLENDVFVGEVSLNG